MDNFIYDFFCVEHQTSSGLLAPGQSVLADIIVPIIVSGIVGYITIHYARKTYQLEKRLAELQVFGLTINISKQRITEITGTNEKTYYKYIIKYANKSHVTGYVNEAYLLLGEDIIAIKSGRTYELIDSSKRLDPLQCNEIGINLDWSKQHYDFKNKVLSVIFKDSLGNKYIKPFPKEKFPELYK